MCVAQHSTAWHSLHSALYPVFGTSHPTPPWHLISSHLFAVPTFLKDHERLTIWTSVQMRRIRLMNLLLLVDLVGFIKSVLSCLGLAAWVSRFVILLIMAFTIGNLLRGYVDVY